MSDTKVIDKALDEYIKSSSETAFVTGWIMVASLSSPEHDTGMADGYVTITSDGLPHHVQLGLLQVSQQDKQSMAMIAALSGVLGQASDDEEWDDD